MTGQDEQEHILTQEKPSREVKTLGEELKIKEKIIQKGTLN